MTSSKILDVVKILECGIGEDFDIEKLRYHKIISLADADVDGLHIQCLWATFFWKHMPEIIEQGMFYLAVPPLYGVKQGKQKQVVVFKFNAKHNYHKKQGHRQPYTKVRIRRIEQK